MRIETADILGLLIVVVALTALMLVTGASEGYPSHPNLNVAPASSIEQSEALCTTDTDCQDKFGGDGY